MKNTHDSPDRYARAVVICRNHCKAGFYKEREFSLCTSKD